MRLLRTEIQTEPDVVLARQRARQVAAAIGFDRQEQIRIAAAVSELARNVYQHAGGGRVLFSIEEDPRRLVVVVSDRGPGIPNIEGVLEGRESSPSGGTTGIQSARRLTDSFQIQSRVGEGTTVTLEKRLPADAPPVTPERMARFGEELARQRRESPYEEVREQNQDLLAALEQLKQRETELELLNRELAETNRGVLALYAELEEKAEALRRSGEIKTRFYSEMNHEVRTPINAILSLSEILLDGTTGAPQPEQEKPLAFIRRAAQNLSQLIDDLLDLARSESGRMVVRPERFTVSELFAGLRGMFRSLHTREEVALSFDEGRNLPPLETDEGKVSQVLRNFISNALKFTERGEVRVTAAAEGDLFVFSVSDTGFGIAPADQQRLFDHFAQVENPRQKVTRGSGIGLAVSRNLAQILGGQVGLSSELGKGSTFRLSIPRVYRAAPEPPSARVEAPPAVVPSLPRDTILLIDDDEVARYLMRSAIGATSLGIVEARSGIEGLQQAREHPPRAIFLDLKMPGMDGVEVLRQLKEDPRTRAIPVIINTSLQLTDEDRSRLAGDTIAILDKEAPGRASAVADVQRALARAGIDDFKNRLGGTS
jgi:signal transduction histidine kinase/CheY-like chemotaxis protein